MEVEARHKPGVARTYETGEIAVYWEPALCIHMANCIRAAPQAFDPAARPWVNVDAASADLIAQAVESCPTGALSYSRPAAQPRPESPTTVQPRPNGPLFVRGDLEVIDVEGNVVRKATAMALCRCGNSQNKPYCDLSHLRSGFKG
jgi:uncharacterized Fe-S cluster protein YjdI